MSLRTGAILLAALGLVSLPGCGKKPADCPTVLDVRLDNLTTMPQRQAKEAEMREFLWKSWRSRQCSILRLTTISKEGKRTDSTFEVKRMQAATMLMTVTVTRVRVGYQGQPIWRQEAKYDVYTVERVQPASPDSLTPNSKVDVLPENSPKPGREYCLRLKGWGDLVEAFF